MATFGSIEASYGDFIASVELSWIYSGAVNNKSKISWELNVTSFTTDIKVETATVKIDNGYGAPITINNIIHIGTSEKVMSGSAEVEHKDNGTKTFSYSFSVNVSIGGVTRTISASGSDELPDISKEPNILSAPNFTDDENPAITYRNLAGDTLDSLELYLADSDDLKNIFAQRSLYKLGTTYTIELTIEERNKLRTAAVNGSLTLYFIIQADYNGKIYSDKVQRTMYLDDSAPEVKPIVEEVDTVIKALTGGSKIVLGYSDIKFNMNASAPEGAKLVTTYAQCGGQKINSTTGTFNNINDNIVMFYADDDRGNATVKEVELEVVPYVKITCNQTIRLNLDGTVALTIKGNYFNGSFGAQNNVIKIEARSRELGGEWLDWGDISVLLADASNGTYTLTGTISGFNPSGTYEFQARASDKLTSADSSVDSVTLKPIFDWGKYDFNFNVPLTIEGDTLADYVIETGTAAMGTNGTWYWSKWKSGKAECYGCRNYGNMAVSTDWGGWFRSEVFNQDLPYGLFAQAPEAISIDLRQGSSGGWVVRHEEEAPTSDTTGSFIIARPKNATISQAYISFNVIGRWK